MLPNALLYCMYESKEKPGHTAGRVSIIILIALKFGCPKARHDAISSRVFILALAFYNNKIKDDNPVLTTKNAVLRSDNVKLLSYINVISPYIIVMVCYNNVIRGDSNVMSAYCHVLSCYRNVMPSYVNVMPPYRDVLSCYRSVLVAYMNVLRSYLNVLRGNKDVMASYIFALCTYRAVLSCYQQVRTSYLFVTRTYCTVAGSCTRFVPEFFENPTGLVRRIRQLAEKADNIFTINRLLTLKIKILNLKTKN